MPFWGHEIVQFLVALQTASTVLDLPTFLILAIRAEYHFFTAYVSIRTVPQSIYGQTQGKKACQGFEQFWAELSLRAATSTVVSCTLTTLLDYDSYPERGCMLSGVSIQGHPLVVSMPITGIVHVAGVVQAFFTSGFLFCGIILDCTKHSFQDWV